MKNKLLDLVVYIYQNYKKADQLSKPRLVKTIYLIDWKHSIDHGKQITSIKWYFNHYGPYVNDVIDTIKANPKLFEVESKQKIYGDGISDHVRFRGSNEVVFEENEKQTIDLILDNIHKYNWREFMAIVYSTYPIKSKPRYSELNLPKLANEFRVTKNTQLT